MKEIIIGVLGGMGTYATIHLFEQYATIFEAEKEWDRPRIVIDNRCTMPSRVRAFLYNEGTDELVSQMAESLSYLLDMGCNRIILACNTSHLFLPKVYEKVPQLEKKVVHIIKCCTEQIETDGLREVYLLGTEGTIESGIYQEILKSKNIKCIAPNEDEYGKLRNCIEAVKQNKYSLETKADFLDLVNRYGACILGCTELPILYEKYKDEVEVEYIYDPLLLVLRQIKKEYNS